MKAVMSFHTRAPSFCKYDPGTDSQVVQLPDRGQLSHLFWTRILDTRGFDISRQEEHEIISKGKARFVDCGGMFPSAGPKTSSMKSWINL